jgi:hypothetical protein
MATSQITEELLGAPLPEMIRDLGLAVAEANKALMAVDTGVEYTIDSAEIEVMVALSLNKTSNTSVSGGASISAVNVNASYARTFGFKEEASSRIKVTLAARPRSKPAGG